MTDEEIIQRTSIILAFAPPVAPLFHHLYFKPINGCLCGSREITSNSIEFVKIKLKGGKMRRWRYEYWPPSTPCCPDCMAVIHELKTAK